MPEHVSILQLTGVAAVALATVVSVVGLMNLLCRGRHAPCEAPDRRLGAALLTLPRQRRSGPDTESVELTPQERAAFAGLVRQFSESRP